jgi:CheY-like chemotaxis protein
MKAYLKGGGFELDFAENGKIAVEKVISGNPHLVLMDLQMPVMDGLEATRAIRQWEAKTYARPIPILALTAHAAETEPEKPGSRLYRAPYQTDQERRLSWRPSPATSAEKSASLPRRY